MISFFYAVYTFLMPRSKNENKKLYSFFRYLTRMTANLLIPIYYKLTQSSHRFCLKDDYDKLKNDERIVVSLTSFPKRITHLWLVIESILRQTKKPSRIILWLSKQQFPDKNSLPKSLLDLQKRGLEIRMVDGDIRSHKKYYYVMSEFPDDIIITIDDDIFYRPTLIEDLYNEHMKKPSTIIFSYGYVMSYNLSGELNPYLQWKLANCEDSKNLFFGSGGGTLIPGVNIFYKDILNIDLARKLCPIADDIWLNVMADLQGTSKKKIYKKNVILPILNPNDKTLASENLGCNLNDKQLHSIYEFYNVKNN